MDRLDELTVLVTIVDEGSLAAAARRLRRSPPAITRVLAALEQRAGARLLERTTRHLAPTETGRTLAARARTLLADYAGALSDLDSAPIRGLIRVRPLHSLNARRRHDPHSLTGRPDRELVGACTASAAT